MTMPANCRRCDIRLTPNKSARTDDTAPHSGRGLCNACYIHEQRAGNLAAYASLNGRDGRPGRPFKHHLAEDFAFIMQSYGGVRANTAIGWDARTRIAAAGRLGVTPGALDAALYRELRKAA